MSVGERTKRELEAKQGKGGWGGRIRRRVGNDCRLLLLALLGLIEAVVDVINIITVVVNLISLLQLEPVSRGVRRARAW